MDFEFDIPLQGVKENKIDAFKDLITRYLTDNDQYNNKAIFDGVYPALAAISKNKSIGDIIKSIDSDISGFQLNWVMNTLAEHSTKGQEIRDIWDKYQKSMEPKKKPRKSKPEEECLDD